MKREMVEVRLYEDGSYTVEDVDSSHYVQRMCGYSAKLNMTYELYYCSKDKWKYYLLKLLSSTIKDIDKQIAKLKRQKRKQEQLNKRILKEIEGGKINDRNIRRRSYWVENCYSK